MKSIFKILLVIAFCFLWFENGHAGNCIPPGTTVTLTRQSEVDSFPINYPGCDVVDGSLIISGNDIVNLNGLRNLKYTNNVLEISNNPNLRTLDGLNSLSLQGYFNILNNASLINLKGLNNLNFVTYLTIRNNSSLLNLKGLEHLKKCSLYLQDNISLINLEGLDSLNTINSILSIENNQSLINLEGMNNLDTIQPQINIVNNLSLLNIEALYKIKNLYSATIENNPSLINLRGFHNVRNIQAWLTIKNNSSIEDLNGLNSLKNIWSLGAYFILNGNQNLKNLNGLDSIDNINGHFYIEKNPSLITLNGLNPDIQIKYFMFINENRILSCCYLAKLIKQNNQNISLYNNDIGCSSVAEVMALTPTSTCCITSYTKDTITICQGQNIKVGTHTYTTTGIYSDTIKIGIGCDSIIVTNLTVRPKSYQIQTKNFCIGQSFTLSNGRIITSNGIYKDSIPNICDSIIEYRLSFLNNITTNQNPVICKGKTYTLPKGKIVSVTGIYKDTLQSSFGCDSIVTTNLTITNPIPNNVNAAVCDGQKYTLPNGKIVIAAGVYTDTIKKPNTCDSVVITNLSVFPNTFTVSLNTTDTIDAGNAIELKPVYSNQTAVSWNWSPNTTLSCSNCENPMASPSQTVQYLLNATSPDGCEDTAVTTVAVRQVYVYMPTAFSPNNDGVNDELKVFATSPKIFMLKIFNRYGELIFQSNDINIKWNGTFKGVNCDTDNYSFILEVTQQNGKQTHQQGSVLLVR